jgi:hypothetical protein
MYLVLGLSHQGRNIDLDVRGRKYQEGGEYYILRRIIELILEK